MTLVRRERTKDGKRKEGTDTHLQTDTDRDKETEIQKEGLNRSKLQERTRPMINVAKH